MQTKINTPVKWSTNFTGQADAHRLLTTKNTKILNSFFRALCGEKRSLLKNNPQGVGMVISGTLCGFFYVTADKR